MALILGAVEDCGLQELSSKDETDGSSDFAKRDGRILLVGSELGNLTGCKEAIDKRQFEVEREQK